MLEEAGVKSLREVLAEEGDIGLDTCWIFVD